MHMKSDLQWLSFFPKSIDYGAPTRGVMLREMGPRARAFGYSERHLQAVWFDPTLRPAVLRTTSGEAVFVEDAGTWNLEAGPDFIGAAVRIGTEQRRVTGDVEIHIHPGDWRAHAHKDDPKYARVRFHVTYFPGVLPSGELPVGAVQIAMKDALVARPDFSFDGVDITAYPFAARATLPPCLAVWKSWSRDAKESVLDAAGQERLRRKTDRFARLMEVRGVDQALWEELMAALGYRNNKTPFRRLAEALPHDALREEAGGDPVVAYAILLGVSGLLPADLKSTWDDETRRFVRSLWDAWWKRKEEYASRVMPLSAWQLGAMRPLNHPVRRLMAAAQLLAGPKKLSDVWLKCARKKGSLASALAAVEDSYWSHRSSLGGEKSSGKQALLGKDRAEALLLNVGIPFLAAMGQQEPFDAGLLDQLPAEQDNSVIRQAAFNLFGPHHAPALYKTGLRRQGLIQIFHDYCLNDRSRCASCAFPELLQGHGDRL